MNSSGLSISILYGIATLLAIVFHLAMLILIAVRPGDGSKAKMLAVIGFAVLSLNAVGGWGAHWILVRMLDSSVIGDALALFSLLRSLLYFVGMSFVVMAVLTGRRPALSGEPGERTSAGPHPPSENPYVPPASG